MRPQFERRPMYFSLISNEVDHELQLAVLAHFQRIGGSIFRIFPHETSEAPGNQKLMFANVGIDRTISTNEREKQRRAGRWTNLSATYQICNACNEVQVIKKLHFPIDKSSFMTSIEYIPSSLSSSHRRT